MNKTYTMQFAVAGNRNKEVVNVGKSFVFVPKAQCKEDSIKWFDESKLLRK